MALIKCPECKKKISSQCSTCPRCGYPISGTTTRESTEDAEREDNVDKEKEVNKKRKVINKKIIIGIIIGIILIVTVAGVILYRALLPRINASKEFKKAVERVEEKNAELDKLIKNSEELISQNQFLLDEELRRVLENTISDVKAVKETDFDIPDSIEEIKVRTKELNNVDYTSSLKELNEKHNLYVIDTQRYQLVNQPTEAYVIQCLNKISNITGISAITEENDPNNQLNKPGSYTAVVYFADYRIDLDESVYGKTLIEQGTVAGGCIEVYSCVEDAVKRQNYLATFDGGIFASGSHTVIGTVLVRVSNELTATQQKELEEKILAVLTYLPEYDKEILIENDDVNQEVTPEPTVKPTATPEPTVEPTATPEPTVKPTATPKPTVKPTATPKPVDRKKEAVAEAEKQAELWFPTDRHFIEEILVNPSLEEGFEAFTESEAQYAIEHANIDWKKHALNIALEILDANPDSEISPKELYAYIEVSGGGNCSCAGFTEQEIQYAVDNSGKNLVQKAINDMKLYWNNDYDVIVTELDFYFYLKELGYNESTIMSALESTSGYYRGEAVANEKERIELLLSYGYTRKAIINWYADTGMDTNEIETIIDNYTNKK